MEWGFGVLAETGELLPAASGSWEAVLAGASLSRVLSQ